MPYADKERERAKTQKWVERYYGDDELLRRAHAARIAIKYLDLDPYMGLAYTIWPERFPEVQRVMEKAAA
jgi:hypothetical protein